MSEGPANFVGADDADIRPVIAVHGSNRGLWSFGAIMAVFGILLFYALESRRETASRSSIESLAGPPGGRISAPPQLFIPGGKAEGGSDSARIGAPLAGAPKDGVPSAGLPYQPAVQRPVRSPRYVPSDPPALPPYVPPLPQVNYDGGVARPLPVANAVDPASQQDRVKAFRFANPATTVPKGTIVQAVLETALDSTRPGYVRAVVALDVSGFDGSRVLIPRGSRLIGEYKSDLAPGQNRALIQWQRLMRPDGVVINLDSPAIDPLGRAGVRGKVDSHFLERFAGAVLQTAVNIGSQVALNRATDGSVIYAVPLAGQGPQVASPDRIQRTLKVRQGASVSVFVAKDLDFTTVEP